MLVSVIIVNYNHKYFPKLAVEALEKSEGNFDMEIIVVDNASHDPESLFFLEKAHDQKRLTLVKLPKNIGFGAGNNVGGRIAMGDYIFIHNPDVMVGPESIALMVDYLESHKDIGILGPQLVYSSGKIQESCRRNMRIFDLILNRTFLGRLPIFRRRVKQYLMKDFDHSKIQDVDLVTGAAMMIPRTVWDSVGGFDERYFLFMEDFDFCREVLKSGGRVVYYPEVKLEHYQKRLSQAPSFLQTVRKKVFWLHIASALKYFWKWRKSW